MIKLTEIRKNYGENEVLKGINLNINQGEFVILLGQSGCGKTTLLNIIGLMESVNQGDYYFSDRLVSKLTFDQKALIRNQSIGFVFQSFHLLNHLKVIDNIALPLGYAGVSKQKRRELARNALVQVGLSDKANSYPSQLSGGQKQRVAIARAIVAEPQLVIADEPTGNLDSVTGQTIMNLFSQINASGRTIIMSTHNENLITYASRVIRMSDGLITDAIESIE